MKIGTKSGKDQMKNRADINHSQNMVKKHFYKVQYR